MKKSILKILLLFLIFLLSFSFIYFLYNKGKGEVSAQEYKVKCAVEIPIGETIDETETLAQEIINTAEFIIQKSVEAADAGEALINLVDQCRAENCQTGCNQYTYQCKPYQCNPYQCNPRPCEGNPKQTCYDICYRTCWQTCYACDVLSCSGNPCPSDQIASEVQKIKDNYEKIKLAYEGGELNGEKIDGIKQLVKKPEEIFPLLGESRNKLKACSSPSEDYEKYLLEGSTLLKLVLSCENAKSMDPTLGDCYQNNYFCCE